MLRSHPIPACQLYFCLSAYVTLTVLVVVSLQKYAYPNITTNYRHAMHSEYCGVRKMGKSEEMKMLNEMHY